ncbi:MAG: SDR family oxidoreductase [Oscillospiraceae bacterium]
MKGKTALITGASSGIGKDIAKILSKKGWRVILVARREGRLLDLAQELAGESRIITADLSAAEACFELYEKVRDEHISILINCAGFGILGEFENIPIEKELEMINVNVRAVHILTKLFVKEFGEKNRGFILNVASVAGLMPAGPLMAAYYASKAYVTSLSLAVNRELKTAQSDVYVGVLCPGPVDTEFNQVANSSFAVPSLSSKKCAAYAVKMMFRRKPLIVPSLSVRLLSFGARFLPKQAVLSFTEDVQTMKRK